MDILFLCGRETTYPFNQFMIDGFRQFSNVNIISEKSLSQSIISRSARVFVSALPKILTNRYDLMFVGFYGQLLMLSAGILSRRPILFHPFISTYETLVYDRKIFSAQSINARLAFWLDQTACRKSTHMLMDTQANIDYLSSTYSIPKRRFTKLYVGSNERIFYPRPLDKSRKNVLVLFHGSFLPLHGIDVIIQAAQILRKHDKIRFRLVGRGMEYKRINTLVKELNLANIEFIDNVPFHQLPEIIAESDMCLGGHFGSSDKAARAIAGKTFQYIAMSKATIVGDTPANRELLTHNYDAWFCPTANSEALAESVLTLAENKELSLSLGRNALNTFLQEASFQKLVPKLKTTVDRLIVQHG